MTRLKTHAFFTIQSASIFISRLNWLPYRTRRSVIKRLCPGMLRNFAFDAAFFDPAWGMRFHGNTVNLVDRRVYFCGAYEKYLLLMLRDYMAALKTAQDGPFTFMDIGAGAGNHSLFMSKITDHVHAFEPFVRVRKQFEYNLSLNRLRNVTVYPVGLSDKNIMMPFYTGGERHCAHKEGYQLGDLELRLGDEVVSELKITPISIIKAELGGYEPYALRGLKSTLKSQRPLVVLELSRETRGMVGGEAEFISLFPDHYRFYYFSVANADRGTYRLAPFVYDEITRRQEVIACPAEKLDYLRV